MSLYVLPPVCGSVWLPSRGTLSPAGLAAPVGLWLFQYTVTALLLLVRPVGPQSVPSPRSEAPSARGALPQTGRPMTTSAAPTSAAARRNRSVRSRPREIRSDPERPAVVDIPVSLVMSRSSESGVSIPGRSVPGG